MKLSPCPCFGLGFDFAWPGRLRGRYLPYSWPAIGFHPTGFGAGASLRSTWHLTGCSATLQGACCCGCVRSSVQAAVWNPLSVYTNIKPVRMVVCWPYGPKGGGWLGGMGWGLGGHGEAKTREFVWGKSVWDVGQKGGNSAICYHLRKIYSYVPVNWVRP